MSKRFHLNSVFKKYAFGYVLIGISLLVSLVISILASTYVSRQYRNATEDLIEINELQNEINNLEGIINMSYLFLSKDGISQYAVVKEQLYNGLKATERQLHTEYIREMVDLNRTIETYADKGDLLMEGLSSYLGEDKESYSHGKLNEKYEEIQDIYSYMDICFQDVYAAKFDRLAMVENKLQHLQKAIYTGLISLMLLIGAASIFYLIRMVRSVGKSIRILQDGVYAMENNVERAEPILLKSNDEFEYLSHAFNSMMKTIQVQLRRIAEDADMKERLSEAEKRNLQIYSDLQKNHLDFLQSRINPHFLFNTLNMISAQARIENADKSAELMELTASFLRYNLDNIKKKVSLEKELQNLKDYLAIQKYRYGNRFSYEIAIQEDCMEQVMPCMILQPLVENAIQHGIGMMLEDGCVWISARKEQERVILEVRDNGIGITEEKMTELYHSLHKDVSVSKHIGIRNIYQRLKLFYQEDCTIELNSPHTGLQITITIPYRKMGS